MGYAFILPVLDDITSLAESGHPDQVLRNVVARIVASGVVVVGGTALTSLIGNIIKKYRV